VRVDDARHERPSAQVHEPGLGPPHLHHFVAIPGGDDFLFTFRNPLTKL